MNGDVIQWNNIKYPKQADFILIPLKEIKIAFGFAISSFM